MQTQRHPPAAAALNFQSFAEFYPYYLAEHSHPMCRRMHFIGTLGGLLLAVALILAGRWYLLPLSLVIGYGFSWYGHFHYEKNRPATFQYPRWSFMGDWVMLKDILAGKVGI